jgi:large subunit ribosomal protein L24
MYGRMEKQKETPRPAKPHVKKGDTVVVLSGRDAGKRGKVLRVDSTKGTAIVERVNFLKKHTKPNPGKNQQGGVVEREAGIKIDKLQLICPTCGEPTRTGHHRTAEGGTRFCRKCKAEIEK